MKVQLTNICKSILNENDDIIDILTDTIIRKQDHLKLWLTEMVEDSVGSGYLPDDISDADVGNIVNSIATNRGLWDTFDSRISKIYSDINNTNKLKSAMNKIT